MTSMNCSCKCACTAITVIGSIIVGIITAILVATATVAITPVFLWVLLGIAVVYLPILLLFTALRRGEGGLCICRALTAIVIGILGTILLALILLGIALPATGFLLPFFAGILLFFFALTLASTACLILCQADCNE
ncbi:MAG: hypothetical protein IJ009_00845 [Clostridia bacterium]|nr:hypothetical protein [Clostridia bacterium]